MAVYRFAVPNNVRQVKGKVKIHIAEKDFTTVFKEFHPILVLQKPEILSLARYKGLNESEMSKSILTCS